MAQTPPGDMGDLGQWSGWIAAALLAVGVFFRDRLFPFWAEQKKTNDQYKQKIQELEHALEIESRKADLERRKLEQAHDQRAEDAILQQVLDNQKALIENLIGVTKDQHSQIQNHTYQSIGQALQEEQRIERDKEFFKWIQGIEQHLAGLHSRLEKIERLLSGKSKSEPGVHDTQQSGKVVT